jgi:hypothetical protein
MSYNRQVSEGNNIPLRVFSVPALLDVQTLSQFKIRGGLAGQVLTALNPAGDLAWGVGGGGGGGIPEAPQDGTPYGRQDAGWNRVIPENGLIDGGSFLPGASEIIQSRRSAALAPPSALLPGELAFIVAAGNVTKVYVGSSTGNRLLLSTVVTDNPIMTAPYVLLSGGDMTGFLTVLPPVLPDDAASKEYVDNALASLGLYMGVWAPAANNPDISAGGTQNGENYLAVTAGGTPEVVTDTIPGLTGLTVQDGDRIIWAQDLGEWQIIPTGNLDVSIADARYVNVTGDSMSGPLNMGAQRVANIALVPLTAGEATSKQYVDNLVAGGFQGVVTDTSLIGNGLLATPLEVAAIDVGTY